jgi:hypothetical protein
MTKAKADLCKAIQKFRLKNVEHFLFAGKNGLKEFKANQKQAY